MGDGDDDDVLKTVVDRRNIMTNDFDEKRKKLMGGRCSLSVTDDEGTQ